MSGDATPVVTEEHVTSSDGTRIGYLRQGSGPELVLVQGAMGTVEHYRRAGEGRTACAAPRAVSEMDAGPA